MRGRPWKCAGCGGQWAAARRPALVLGAPRRLRLCADCAARTRTVAAVARQSAGLPAEGPRARWVTVAAFRASRNR